MQTTAQDFIATQAAMQTYSTLAKRFAKDCDELLEALRSIESMWRDSDSENTLAFEMSEVARKAIEKAKI